MSAALLAGLLLAGCSASEPAERTREDLTGAELWVNPDTTAGVGETVSYEWYADTELGATNLLDYGDVRGHRHHGLAGALIVEPQHATYHDPITGAPVLSARSMIFTIFLALASESEPPNTVKSCANT